MNSVEAGKLNSTILACLAVLFGMYWLWGLSHQHWRRLARSLGMLHGYTQTDQAPRYVRSIHSFYKTI